MNTLNKANKAKNLKSESFVAERELLTKLMNLIESLLERKDAILDAIDSFHNELGNSLNGPGDEFKQHYDWLQDNLLQTNLALEAGLTYQQVMYGKMYSGTSLVTLNTGSDSDLMIPDSHHGRKWGHTLHRCAMELGAEVTKRTLHDQALSNSETVINSVSSAAALILTTDILSGIKYGKGLKSVAGALRQNMFSLKLEPIPALPKELSKVATSRQAAMEDLEEALNMLQSELKISGVSTAQSN